MSLDRRKPFARLQPNDSKPADAAPTEATATARLTISRPRRQMPAYHYQHQQFPQNSQKRYATMIPGSTRSSATSSAESLYSTAGSVPRRRKLSAAEDVAARVRARWAALEALERAGGGSHSHSHSGPGNTDAQKRRRSLSCGADKENAVSMQVDAYEKPLPPHPPALALRIGASAPASVDGHTTAAVTTAGTTVVMMMDTREDGGPASAPAAVMRPGDSTVRTTPTSLTFVETDSASPGPALQRRPTRAVTPPQVRRRASITDELEEAVSPPFFFSIVFADYMSGAVEGRGDAHDAPKPAHGRPATLSAPWMRRAAWRCAGAYVPPTHTCGRRWLVRVRAVRGRI